jgi:Uma2 family endonuclease
VLASPADLQLEPGTVLQPDVFVVPTADGRGPGAWAEIASLLLAVEVLSRGTARADRVTQRRFFQRVGVAEYWVVDVGSRVIERWRPGDDRPEVLDLRLDWQPAGAAGSFTLDLGEFFARVHRER